MKISHQTSPWLEQPARDESALAETYGTLPPFTHTISGEGASSSGQLTTRVVFDWQAKGEGVYISHLCVLAHIERKDRMVPWRRPLMSDYRGSQKWFWLATWSGLRAAAHHQKYWCRLLYFSSLSPFYLNKTRNRYWTSGSGFQVFLQPDLHQKA